ncbi:MAG: 4-(cytidine 5'-diphospho)-2-C-methyl-D-erythritol kinase [Lachnospiraceae bacterium]|nr:4-(cytidine 5'-diphospho)-2-C-methyl-D-erythritol kinase [Lachnospiraceae bacterium]
MIVNAYAKINLTLDVVGVFENGYHDLRMVMQSVDLFDVVHIEKREDSLITLKTDNDLLNELPVEQNLAYKACKSLMEKYEINHGFDIFIEKNIPEAAGLAGGSSDCAAVLRGVNALCNLKLSVNELCEVGVKLGADVPYCIAGKTKLCEGIGEKMTELRSFKGCPVLLVKPSISVKTGGIYGRYDALDPSIIEHPDTEAMLAVLEIPEDSENSKEISEDSKKELKDLREDICDESCDASCDTSLINKVSAQLKNVLEHVTIPDNPVVDVIKNDLKNMGAAGVLMSGSGPTVFALFESDEKAQDAYKKCQEKYKEDFVFLGHTI